jgi:capsule polysaccharide export protein KpsE/RkpR
MATREITKRNAKYGDPQLEEELVIEAEDGVLHQHRGVARFALLWQERQSLFRWTVIGLVASTIIAFLIPVRYTTTTRLMPPDQAGQGMASVLAVLGKSTDLGTLGSQLMGVKTSGDLFVGVLHSETVQNAIVNKFDLRKVYGDRRWVDARKTLEDRSDISTDRKSGLITIKVSDRNPERAAAIGREYVEQLNNVVITLDTSAAHRERVFLETRLKQVQVDLESAEKDFSQFASKNTALDVKEQGRAMLNASAQLEGELIAAETQLEGLRQIYTASNVRVRSLQARIDEYKHQLQKMTGQAGSTTGEAAQNPDAAANEDLYPSIRQLPILGVSWADLYRRTRVQEAVFETLTKQYEMAKVEEARETPSVKVLDVAEVPERKSYPPRLLLIILGTVMAMTMASLWIIWSVSWRALDSTDPRKILALDVMGTIRARAERVWRRIHTSGERTPKAASPSRHSGPENGA